VAPVTAGSERAAPVQAVLVRVADLAPASATDRAAAQESPEL
jgi:hypothetical protein